MTYNKQQVHIIELLKQEHLKTNEPQYWSVLIKRDPVPYDDMVKKISLKTGLKNAVVFDCLEDFRVSTLGADPYSDYHSLNVSANRKRRDKKKGNNVS